MKTIAEDEVSCVKQYQMKDENKAFEDVRVKFE